MDVQSPDYRQALLHSPENRRTSTAGSPAYFTLSGQSLKYMPEFVEMVDPHSPEGKVNVMNVDYEQPAVAVQSPEFSAMGREAYSPVVTLQQTVPVLQVGTEK